MTSLRAVPRFRIIKEMPDQIRYHNGTVHFLDYYAGGKDWVWYCRREVIQHGSVHICQAEGADQLEKMRKEGVVVKKGSLAESVLQSLVRKGYAERLPD